MIRVAAIGLLFCACATPERLPFHHIEPADDWQPYTPRETTIPWERHRPPDESREVCRYRTALDFDASTWTDPPDNPSPTYCSDTPACDPPTQPEAWTPYAP